MIIWLALVSWPSPWRQKRPLTNVCLWYLTPAVAKCYITSLPSVMDLEHFIDSFLARLSNQVPNLCPPVARLANVLDFCRVFISIVPSDREAGREIRALHWQNVITGPGGITGNKAQYPGCSCHSVPVLSQCWLSRLRGPYHSSQFTLTEWLTISCATKRPHTRAVRRLVRPSEGECPESWSDAGGERCWSSAVL